MNEQLIKTLNQMSITQTGDLDDILSSDVPEEYRNIFNKDNIVAGGLEVDKHRWYETCICVFKSGDSFIGVRYCSQSYSEGQTFDDIRWILAFVPMKAVQTTIYQYDRK